MGVWSKIGQTLLRAAPYVAAPFTGGASLTMAGTANNLAGAWANKDAQKQYEKTGIAPSPSKFDQISNMAGNVGAMAGGMGAFGKGDFGAGGKFGSNSFNGIGPSMGGGGFGKFMGGMGGQQGGGWQGNVGNMARNVMMGQGGGSQNSGIWERNPMGQNGGMTPPYFPSSVNRQGGGYNPNDQSMGRFENRNPNLQNYIRQGVNEGIMGRQGGGPYPQQPYGGYFPPYGIGANGPNPQQQFQMPQQNNQAIQRMGGMMGPSPGMMNGYIDPRTYGGQRSPYAMY